MIDVCSEKYHNEAPLILYKKKDHVVKSIIEELKTREAFIIEISEYADDQDELSIKLPNNKSYT